MNNVKKLIKGNLRKYTMLIALVVIVIFFSIMTDGKLLYPMNISNIVFQNAYVVILAVGMLICILTGGNIDLSVGSVVALVGACAGTFIISWGWNPYVSIFLCLVIGILIGMWQGFWIAYIRIPAFIVTLSGMLVFRGLTLVILNGLTLAPFPAEYLAFSTGFISNIAEVSFLGAKNLTSLIVGFGGALLFCVLQVRNYRMRARKGYENEGAFMLCAKMVVISAALVWFFFLLAKFRGVPTVLILLGIILLVYSYITQNTVIGRHVYAIGGNEKAARLSGVKTNKLIFLAFVNMSFLAAVAGLVFAARLNSASPQAGMSFEMDAIGSCYIGGASAYGGVGTVSGTLIGALIMGILNNGMSIMGIDSNIQQVVKGLVLLMAVAFDVISKMQINWPKFKKVKEDNSKTTSI